MLSFFKKKTPASPAEVEPLLVDLHSHLIPSIDDGAQSMEESIELIKGLARQGYKRVITTPHVMFDSYTNSRKSILDGLESLRSEVFAQEIDMAVDAAAEYYLDEGLLPLIKSDDVLLVANKYLLFETSYTHRPMQLEEIIFEILSAGHTPLLAHPERYRYIKNLEEEYSQLKDLGVEFQVNINSFSGYYGSQAKSKALFLSQNSMIDFLGSDTHNMQQVYNLSEVFASDSYREIYSHNRIKNSRLM